VRAGWQESTLTRASEIEALAAWLQENDPPPRSAVLFATIADYLQAARDAATGAPLSPRRLLRRPRGGGLVERALSNLDAAETQLLNAAPARYLLGMMPSVLSNVQRHLVPSDARRTELERIAQSLGIKDPDHPKLQARAPMTTEQKRALVEEGRGEIVAAMRAARSAALREQVRIRDFRNVVAWTTAAMTVLAALAAVAGWFAESNIPLCFAPEEGGRAVVVCPTAQSPSFSADRFTGAGDTLVPPQDIDVFVQQAARPWDVAIVELMGLLAAAVAAALAIRNIRGSSERHSVLVWLAALKLPTGAVTAVLGLMLMRGQFIPGLSALDTSAQILAWALIFGYAQQLFTRLVDQQGQTVLNSARGADAGPAAATPP
jgi:hypothetical protein